MTNTHKKYPRRKHNRLRVWDYSTPHWYYVTICTQNHRELFGEIIKGKMVLNEYGLMVQKRWLWLKEHYEYVDLDEFIVMPNHFHGILIIVGSDRDLTKNNEQRKKRTSPDLSLQKLVKIKPLSELIGAFKTTSSKSIHRNGLPNFSWQRSYYDHIIRDEKSLDNISFYIQGNPLTWETDKNNPENLKN